MDEYEKYHNDKLTAIIEEIKLKRMESEKTGEKISDKDIGYINERLNILDIEPWRPLV